MTTWLVTGDYPPGFTGGVASWAEDLAAALSAAGEAVTVLARATGDTAAHDTRSPWPVIRVSGRSWGEWQGAWVALAGAGRVRAGDAVIFATWSLAGWLGPIARRRGARVAVAAHGSDLTRQAAPTAALRRALGSAHALLPVSGFLAAELVRLGYARATVLPMALDLGPPPQQRARVGLICVARLGPLKGVDRAIGLARALGEPLTIIGDGPGLPEARARDPDLDWRGRLGRDETRAALAGARAAVLLPRPDADGSGAEGLGLALIEAAAAGTAAIGCRTGGVPEAVGPGLVLERPDDPASELDRVRALLDDPLAGARARAWVEARHGPAHAVSALRAALAADGSPRG